MMSKTLLKSHSEKICIETLLKKLRYKKAARTPSKKLPAINDQIDMLFKN